jgi:ketosteroid isomerase-like protein
MSQENVEVATRAWKHMIRGDVDAVLRHFTDDAEHHPSSLVPNPRVYRGHDEIARWIRSWPRFWDELNWHVEEIRPVGEQVLVLFWVRAKGKESGVPVEHLAAQLVSFREAKIARTQDFTSEAEALEAAGLRE